MPVSAQHSSPAGLLALLAIVLPVVQAYSPPIVVPVMVLAALAIVVRSWPQITLPRPSEWLVLCFAAVTLSGLLSALWAVDWRFSLLMGLKLLGLFVCCLVVLNAALSIDQRRPIRTAILVGFLLALANAEVAFVTDGGTIAWLQALYSRVGGAQRPLVMPVALDTTMTLIGLLVWPALAVAVRRFGWVAAVALYALGLLVIRQGGSFTAVIATLVGGGAFVGARLFPKIAAILCGPGIALWILLAPVLLRPQATAWITATLPFLKAKEGSWDHRRAIWGFVSDRIGERPIAGWGLGSSRAIPGGHTLIGPGAEILPLHPHDAALQLWLELGTVGALLGAVFFLCLVRTTYRALPDRTEFALAIALIVSATVNAMASYNLWHEWWLTFLITAACLFVAASEQRSAA
jgi:O-antigen ligase